MNGDPYRGQQSPDRRVINRSGTGSSPAQPQRTTEERTPQDDATPRAPRVAQESQEPRASRKGGRSSRGLLTTISIIGILLIVVLGGWFAWNTLNANQESGIDKDKYQAVFLSNGQIYFGKLHAYNNEYLRLTSGYYPQQTNTDATDSETTQAAQNGSIKLIPVGDEIPWSEDEIFISKKQVLHFENLKSDSKVSQLITQNQASK